MSEKFEFLQIRNLADIPTLPAALSYFPVPYLLYWANEALELDGEVEVAKTSNGEIHGLFVYDNYEKDGTIFTRSKQVFDYYYGLKSCSSLWSEVETANPCYHYDILSRVLDNVTFDHKFKHKVVIEKDIHEIERFMSFISHNEVNPKWVSVASGNGDRCFAVRVENDIVGVAWLSLVDGVGRVPDLYVKPQYRRTGIARDLFYARLIYLQSMRAKSYFAEIAHDNEAALGHATKVGMKVSGKIFEYQTETGVPAKE